MCDTFVALPNATQANILLFAKNSDRDPNEAHEVIMIPACQHDETVLKATYIEIPQVRHTHAVLLCKPFWIWGAEMGVNEHGVVIGNEAVFSKVPAGKTPGLIGMDYLRLGLERGSSAEEALNVIIALLEQYAQSGNCGYEHELYYHNSYLIADSHAAFVLETVGKEWAVEKVKDIRSISNQISITTQYDRVSQNLIPEAVERGWSRDGSDFNFHDAYSDFLFTKFSDAQARSCDTLNGLAGEMGHISEETMFQLLRHHRKEAPSTNAVSGADVCMHAAYGPIRGSQTTGSLVVRVAPTGILCWVTGTAAPCTGIFKPVWFEGGLPVMGKPVKGQYDADVLWWRHEKLHRLIMADYKNRILAISPERDQLEKDFLQAVREADQANPEAKLRISQEIFDQAGAVTQSWIRVVENMEPMKREFAFYRANWKKLNNKVGLDTQRKEAK